MTCTLRVRVNLSRVLHHSRFLEPSSAPSSAQRLVVPRKDYLIPIGLFVGIHSVYICIQWWQMKWQKKKDNGDIPNAFIDFAVKKKKHMNWIGFRIISIKLSTLVQAPLCIVFLFRKISAAYYATHSLSLWLLKAGMCYFETTTTKQQANRGAW